MFTLITGGSKGIGKALALECARRGMDLLLIALPADGLEDTAEEIRRQYPVTVHTLAIDLTDLKGPGEVHRWCTRNGYSVNILINNAGMGGTAVFGHSNTAYSDTMIMINIRALTLLTHLFLPSMKKLPQAYILNIASMGAFFAIPYKTVYSSSKAYVLNFTRALQAELRKSPVSVSVVCPSGVQTNADVNGRIHAHGWKGQLTKSPLDQLSRETIDKMLKRKTVIIPRPANRILLLINKCIPRALTQYLVAKEFEKEIRNT
ncbi:MAG TPA: SDR family NAD(P)-dependent oxidoreductase [Bacteroidales bacterium]|nr:SDR family NAD(P)-dependent oxidoreductase [Bacteroidales bacterium]